MHHRYIPMMNSTKSETNFWFETIRAKMHLKADIYLFNGIMKGEMIYDINNKIILDKVVLFYILLVYLKNCFPLFFLSFDLAVLFPGSVYTCTPGSHWSGFRNFQNWCLWYVFNILMHCNMYTKYKLFRHVFRKCER